VKSPGRQCFTLFAELRWLTSHALASGADRGRVQAIADGLIDLILDAQDPRRQRSLDLAQRIGKARAAGVSIPDLCERFGKSRSQIHRLLARVSHELRDYTRQLPDEVAPSEATGSKS
jgi:hypothetical protein